MPSGPDDRDSDARMALWRRARHAELCEGHVSDGEGAIGQPDVLEGPGFLYRPRQVLFETGVMQTQPVETELQKHGGVPDDQLNQRFDEAKLPIQAYLMPPEVYLPGLIAQLRTPDSERGTGIALIFAVLLLVIAGSAGFGVVLAATILSQPVSPPWVESPAPPALPPQLTIPDAPADDLALSADPPSDSATPAVPPQY